MDGIKGKKNQQNFKIKKSWFYQKFLEEEEMKRIEKVLRSSTTFDLGQELRGERVI